MKLTARRVTAYAKRPGRYPDGNNLYLQVINPSNVSWQFRFRSNGKERWMGLGPLHTVSLAEARERAKMARLKLLDGIDPLDQKRADKAQRALEAARNLTFEEAARTWHAQHEAGWKSPKHARQTLTTLETYAFPKIGALPVGAIDTGQVLRVLEPIWTDRTETASRLRGRIESVLAWATVRNFRSGDNPARWSGHLDETLPAPGKVAKIAHHAALDYRELPAFINELRAQSGIAARALEFTILTATRAGEVLGATWSEINLDEGIWVIPPSRMKSGREHRVPLAPQVIELLNGLYHEDHNNHLFIGSQRGRGLSKNALGLVLARLGRSVTTHGFRSTFSDWAHERTAYPSHVIEMALAHTIGSKVEAAYRRGDLFDKRRELMVVWAKYCGEPSAAGEVVPLRPRP
jgi:integrase